MENTQKPKVEFRYYATLPQLPIYFLTGDNWLNCIGTRTACLHFHNLMEIGYCYNGNGNLLLGDQGLKIQPHMISIIPPIIPIPQTVFPAVSSPGNIYLSILTNAWKLPTEITKPS